jgi:pimeloyl-ACP methyl ester carboxylesterase
LRQAETPSRSLQTDLCDASRLAGRDLVHRLHGDPGQPVLLFLHGITGSRNYWGRAVDRFADNWHLVLPDLMGFGGSPKPYLDHDMTGHVSALRGFLEQVGFAERPLAIVAHSLGALVSVEYALRWPGQVRQAVLLGLPVYANRREAHEYFLAGSPNYRRLVGEHSLAANLKSWRQAGAGMALRYLFAFSPKIAADSKSWTLRSLTSTIEHCLLGHRVQDRVERLARRTADERPEMLLIHGERDQVTPLHRVEELLPRLPEVELETVDGTGHHPYRTHQRRVLERIEAFLSPAATAI